MNTNIINTNNLYIEPYYSEIEKYYYHIITINKEPLGPLKNHISTVSKTNPSTKINKANENSCIYVIKLSILNNNIINNKLNICTIENILDIHDFLINNNYSINNTMTELLNSKNLTLNNSKKILFTITYKID